MSVPEKGDPMVFSSSEFVDRQNPLFAVEKRIGAVWLDTNVGYARPGEKYTFKVYVEDIHAFSSNDHEIHLRVFDITEGVDIQLLSENVLLVSGTQVPLPVNK